MNGYYYIDMFGNAYYVHWGNQHSGDCVTIRLYTFLLTEPTYTYWWG